MDWYNQPHTPDELYKALDDFNVQTVHEILATLPQFSDEELNRLCFLRYLYQEGKLN